jgi:S1-C subfamily serine protease
MGGDMVIRFAGKTIGDLYAYTYALRDQKPGDTVEIVVLRDGKEVTVHAVLESRD